jgi:hypothetical protein
MKSSVASSPREPYEVFISFKNTGESGRPTPDAAWARKVYEKLKEEGIRAFFSEVELEKTGKGHFTRGIDGALESARILILVASSRAHVESRWVEFEWDTFLNDVRSGRKDGELFVLRCGDLRAQNLPVSLRRQQMFGEAELEKLVTWTRNALPRRVALEDLVKFSLHCCRPAQGEDKVYLITVKKDDQERHEVKAYWGARSTRRLNSQLKGVGIQDSTEAERLANSLHREKLAAGYKPKPVGKLLTPQARAMLEHDLKVKLLHPADHIASARGLSNDELSEEIKQVLRDAVETLSRTAPKAAQNLVTQLLQGSSQFQFLKKRIRTRKAKA